jgi:hypothetical protein
MTEKKISRRDAMKMLGVAVGAAALSTLPSKWNTPELVAGVLPAHARQSAQPVVHTFTSPGQILSGLPFIFPRMNITPADASITLNWTVIQIGFTMKSAPKMARLGQPQSGQVVTNGSGVGLGEETEINGASEETNEVVLRWSFANPLDGTGTVDQSYINQNFPV